MSNNPFRQPKRQPSTLTVHNVPYYSPLHPEPNFDFANLQLTPSSAASASDLTLTPLRAHYLKRTLLSLALQRELAQLGRADALTVLGPPFVPASGTVASSHQSLDLPLTRFLLHHFVLSFPLLSAANKTFYTDLQRFVEGFLTRNIQTDDDEDDSTRLKLAKKLEKYLALILSSAIKLADNQGREEVVRIQDSSQPLVQIEAAHKDLPAVPVDDFNVNVVTVRTVVVKGRLRNSSREEFLIRTNLNGAETIVSRRYRDFNKLAQDLRKEFPEEDVRPPPSKDRQATSHSSSAPIGQTDSFDSEMTGSPAETSLARERNRLTLRAYLRNLLTFAPIASSELMRSFLTLDPTTLTAAESSSIAVRENLDRQRDASTQQFKAEVNRRVQELQGHLQAFKAEMMAPDGLSNVFSTIRNVPKVEDLPERYRKLLEWGRISLASALFSTFLGDDDSSSTLAGLKRMHGLMPYWALRGILRISNPVAMIRAFMDLFLARPFGQASLIQRMLGGGLDAEVKELREDADLVREKIGDEVMCEKIRSYVDAPREVQQHYEYDAAQEHLDLMAVILRSSELPVLDGPTLRRVAKAHAAYKVYKAKREQLLSHGKTDPGPDNDDAWLFEDLHVYLRLVRRARNKEQLVQLIFEGSTSDILKDLVTIFYQPLAQVYRAANIADSLSDLQNFINDMIKTIDAAEVTGTGHADPARTVQAFCDLCGRHEQAFYNFVHRVHTKGKDLFDAIMHWIERFINIVRDGLPIPPISLEVLLPHAGKERVDVINEIDSIVEYHRRLKVAAHQRLRRRLVRGELAMEVNQQRDEDSAFVRDVLGGVGAQGMADDMEDDAADSDMEEGLSDDEGSEAIEKAEHIHMPELKVVPGLMGVFVEQVRPGLEEAKRRAK